MKELSYDNSVVQKDLSEIITENYSWEKLIGKSVLITGANGMLATYIIYTLFYLNAEKNYNIKITALARNKEKAEKLFSAMIGNKNFDILFQDICQLIDLHGNIDYIIHAAGSASAFAIVNDPIGIVKANTLGTINVLELARKNNTQKILFTSTREVYGKTENILSLTETDFGTIDPLDIRSCYPESKRIAETILKSYQTQYGINFNTVRIAHSYGPGMKIENDGRIMADLISNIVYNHDIVLKSKGDAIRAFCYITDTLKALFLALLEGKTGEAYNVANETEPITIKNLAELLVDLFPEKKLKIKYITPEINKGYIHYERVALDTGKIGQLGWNPTVSLIDGLKRVIKSFEE